MNSDIKTRLLLTCIGLLTVLITGTTGYYFLTDGSYDIFTCFYMTVITITTIGFDEIIDLKNHHGARAFTVLLAFTGIGLLTYFVTSISAIIIEGHLRETYKKIKMEKTISKFHDHYIICGVGKHAMHLIDELLSTKRDSVFIELDPEVIKQVTKKYPLQKYIEGDATHDDVLLKAGVQNAKGLFAATKDDNVNLVISLSAKRLNPNFKVVSLCSVHANQDKLKVAGADHIILPNYIGGLRMASEMLRPTVTQFLDVMLRDRENNLRIEQIDLTEKNEGQTLGVLKIAELEHTLLIAIKSNDEILFKPKDEYVVKKGDALLVMTTPEERITLEKLT